jgi:hypothetical protein
VDLSQLAANAAGQGHVVQVLNFPLQYLLPEALLCTVMHNDTQYVRLPDCCGACMMTLSVRGCQIPVGACMMTHSV